MITETTVPATPAAPASKRTRPDFFSAAEARVDQWRQFCAVVRAWQAAAAKGASEDAIFAQAIAVFGELAPLEAYFAYPGSKLLGAIEQALAERNVGVCVRLSQHLSSALLTGTYRYDLSAWDPLQEEGSSPAEVLPPDMQGSSGPKPYFETLVVTPVATRRIVILGAAHADAMATPSAGLCARTE